MKPAALPLLPPGVTWEALHQRYLAGLRAEGLLSPSLEAPLTRGVVVSLVKVGVWAYLLTAPAWPQRLVALCLGGLCVLQAGLLSHEIAHFSVSRRPWLSEALGQWFMSVLAGQSYGHWAQNHAAHHRHTQEPLADPDMDVDAFALSAWAAQRKRGLTRLTTRAQWLVFWPLATLMAIVIKVNSVRWIVANRSVLNALTYAVHLGVWLVPPALVLGPGAAALNFVVYSWFVGPWLMVAFYWNHIGSGVVPPGERWPYFAQRLVTTRNLSEGWLNTYFFGGLNLHLEHHLAPTVPLRRLPAARRVLRGVLAEAGLELPVWTWLGAMREVHQHVQAMAREAPATEPRGVAARV